MKPDSDHGWQLFLEGLASNNSHQIEAGLREMAAAYRLKIPQEIQ